MLRARVLSVGHGLCVHLSANRYRFDHDPWYWFEGGEQLVYDCGTHRPVTASGVPRAWRALTNSRSRNISKIAVSHLHSDHYNGFLYPLPQLSPYVEIVLARMPVINSDSAVSTNYLMRALAFGTLSSDDGPMEIDLLSQVRKYAPGAVPALVSQGEHFVAAGQTWDVLWPPRSLNLHQRGLRVVKRAIQAYDDAAKSDPELERRLDEVRDSELFRQLVAEMDTKDEDPVALIEDEDEVDDEDEEEGTAEKLRGDAIVRISPRLAARREAGRAIGRAANYLSLIIASRDDRVLLLGDATKSVTNAAISRMKYRHLGLVTTPHHGGRRHVARDLKLLSAQIWATSAGGAVSDMVSDRYDALPGLHVRVDESRPGIDAAIQGHELVRLQQLRRFTDWQPPRASKS